jgi:hypothetical protein
MALQKFTMDSSWCRGNHVVGENASMLGGAFFIGDELFFLAGYALAL